MGSSSLRLLNQSTLSNVANSTASNDRHGVTLQQMIGKVSEANRSFVAGSVRDGAASRVVVAGQTLMGVPDMVAGPAVMYASQAVEAYDQYAAKVRPAGSAADDGIAASSSRRPS